MRSVFHSKFSCPRNSRPCTSYDVLHLNFVFVLTCPRVSLSVGREAVILCGTFCVLVVSGIRIVSPTNAYYVLVLVH